MRKKQEIKSVCGNCKKEQPIDKEKSNKNWKYYDI